MKGGGGLVGAVTPRRFNSNGENTKNGDHAVVYTPGKERERETIEETVLSSLIINAISGKVGSLHIKSQSGKINQANAKQTKQAEPPIRAPDGNPTVVWNNAIFQSEEDRGVWGVGSCSSSSNSDSHTQSLSEVSSNRIGTMEQDKEELHSKVVIKTLPSSLPIQCTESNPEDQNCSPGIESIASSVQIPNHKKQNAQPTKKVLFSSSTENANQISEAVACGDHEDNIDNGIEEIEKEILRLTEKLEKLKFQQAAKQKNQEVQCSSEPQKEVNSPKKNGKGSEAQGSNVEEPKSSEKPRRGRIVSAKFLQWESSSKKEQKPLESGKKGRGGMSPKIQRRAASLGPAEHLRFSQMSGKGKGDEHSMQKFNNGSSRNWSKGTEKTKNMDVKVRSLSLSPVPQHPIETKGSNLRRAGVGGSMSARKPGPTPLKDSARSTQWLHPKKLFPPSDFKKYINTNSLSLSSKAFPEQLQKSSPSLKNARFVASRYGQALTPSRERATRNPQSSLSSLKNSCGKRFFPDDEFGRMDNNSFKRRPAVASSPNARNPQTDKTVVTPRSRTPGKSAARLEPKKIGKPTATPARQGTIGTNNQQKGTSNRSAFANTSNLVQTNPSEIHAPDGTKNYCFSAGTKSPDTVDRNRMQLPRIRTVRLKAQSPRDSGCIKRAVDRVGKKSFFASDENITANPTDMETADKSSRIEIGDDIKHAFSFEDEETGG